MSTATIIHMATHFLAAVPQQAYDTREKESLNYVLLPTSSLLPVRQERDNNEELSSYWHTSHVLGQLKWRASWPS